jgi:hypothetical protein
MRRGRAALASPLDAIVTFRMLVLQALNNLSDNRWSIRCVIGCRSRDFCSLTSMAAFRTLRLFREKLAKA